MIVSCTLLTEHHLEFLSLIGGCTGSSEYVYSCQNATLLEITCRGSFTFVMFFERTEGINQIKFRMKFSLSKFMAQILFSVQSRIAAKGADRAHPT